ncbi:chemotaxis protein CheA [Thalassococcus profundi]|uniref:Chemotaxis protein CheA n=1 Tax=Thalassococcus profundi TaxID=2282382 RepID=A0A369TL82_9RHOB|nr:chemotaxis protein CheA [Thalassococcus profundi]RDD66063.1 chemotaxis protein CheA [Thalassococcus profundi]
MSGAPSIRDMFFEECEELLEALVEGLAGLEASGPDAAESLDTVNAVFRAVHSIKGGAGAFGLDALVDFAHTFETVLDKVRSGSLTADADLMRLFHRSGDQLANLVEAARDDVPANAEAAGAVLSELQKYLGDEDAEEDFVFEAMGLDLGESASVLTPDTFEISFVPKRALYENGHEPLLLFDALAELGTLEVTADTTGIPAFDGFDPTDAYLGWTLRLTTTESETLLHEIFEFVEALCTLDITKSSAAAPAPEPPGLIDLPDLGGLPDLTELPDTSALPDPDPIAAEAPAASAGKTHEKEVRGPKPTLRVDLDRVDRLINTVGELIINQAMISQRIEELDLPSVAHVTNELEAYKLLARDIQEGVMAIRAQPVKPLFQRMSRIVREASDATGKTARIVTQGDSTEVDKTVIERLADPMTHMVRNAVDHGLEAPDARIAAGKDPCGTIRLSAAHRSGSVFIEISDDGAGLNRERILATAIAKNLVPADAELTESEIDNLLFLPGFSTANAVSNLSGRGVGMDVVKNAVQALGGRVSISSQTGKGSTFSIVLPLTLAVLDGFVISVADQTMVIPIASILETVRPQARDLHRIGIDDQVISIRGNYVPVVDVAANLGIRRSGPAPCGILLLVATDPRGMSALRVDAIHDQRQVVIKSLESNYGRIPGVSAATILGDGKIALILDPEELVNLNMGAQPSAGLPPPVQKELRHVDGT